MKNRGHIEENHRDMPADVLQALYSRCDTAELQSVLEKFRRCKKPDAYTLSCRRVVENELVKRGVVFDEL